MSIWLTGLIRAEKMVHKYGVSFTVSVVLSLDSDEWPQELIEGMVDYLNYFDKNKKSIQPVRTVQIENNESYKGPFSISNNQLSINNQYRGVKWL